MVFSKKKYARIADLKGSWQPGLGLTNIWGGNLSEGRKGLSNRARVLLPPWSNRVLPRVSISLAFFKLCPSICCSASSSDFPRASVLPLLAALVLY